MTQETDDNVFYSGNGTVGRENMTAPTGYFFQMPKREWVGLTDGEIENLWEMAQAWNAPKHFYILIEAKLKEKNT
jgi:hypothetical protein